MKERELNASPNNQAVHTDTRVRVMPISVCPINTSLGKFNTRAMQQTRMTRVYSPFYNGKSKELMDSSLPETLCMRALTREK